MIKNRLKRSDCELSRIGLGTAQFGMDYGFTKEKSQEEVNEILDYCFKEGINFLDTAREYGNSELKIGNYIKENPNAEFVIATKIKHIKEDEKDVVHFLNNSVNTSLRCLNIEKIDLLFLHQTDKYVTRNEVFWEVMRKYRSRGVIVLFGISVYDVEETKHLIEQHSEIIDIIQVPYSVFDRRFEQIFPWAKKHNIDIITRSAFLRGTITANADMLPAKLSGIKPFKQKLAELAEQLDIPVSVLALSFVLENQAVCSTILGVDSVEEMKQNVDALKTINRVKEVSDQLNELSIQEPVLVDPRQWTEV